MLFKKKNRYRIFIFLLLLPAFLYAERPVSPQEDIIVGVFPFEPFSTVNESGQVSGLFPELLREMTKDEEWQVTFLPGTWAEGLERLQNEEIDLMICVAYTPERDLYMDYNFESVVELWGQIFVNPKDKSINIDDLENKTVGIMEKDISGDNFKQTAADLGINPLYEEYPSHDEIFLALGKGKIDAAVAPQHFGLRNGKDYGIVPTSILFSPFSIYFTVKEGYHRNLLNTIDANLILWKDDQNSIYYDLLYQWTGGDKKTVETIPYWLLIALGSTTAFVVLFLLFTILLRRIVRQKSDELENKNLELKHSEKMNAIGQLAGGVAHDFNNQLLPILGFAELIRDEASNSHIREYAENIILCTERSADLTKKLLSFARKNPMMKEAIDINVLVNETIRLFKMSLKKKMTIDISSPSQGEIVMEGDKNQLEHALLNLMLNARDAMEDGGELKIHLQKITTLPASITHDKPEPSNIYLMISIKDTGSGFSSETGQRIFDPFFTTKDINEGTGLGLPSVYGTVKEHGGSITYKSKIGEGTEFTLYFPLKD